MEECQRYIWPEVFQTGVGDYKGKDGRLKAVADGLEGWALAHVSKPPENFGVGMVKIGKVLGIVALQGNLERLYREFFPELFDLP